MRRVLLLLLLPVPALGVDLTEAVRAAAARDPAVQAAGVRLEELKGAAEAAQGSFDLFGSFGLGYGLGRQVDVVQGLKVLVDSQALTLSAGISQRLVWGTQLSLAVGQGMGTAEALSLSGQSLGSEDSVNTELRLTVLQPLLKGAGREVNTIAETRVSAEEATAQARRVATASALVETLVATWVELAFAEANVRIQQRALELAGTQQESSRRQVAGGRLAPVDLAVVEQAVAEREQALFVAQQQAAGRRSEIEQRTGLKVETAGLPEPLTWAEDEAATRTAAEEANAELLVAKALIARQALELPLLRDQTRMQLDLELIATQQGVDEAYGGSVAALPDNQRYVASLALAFPFQNRFAEGQLFQAEKVMERLKLEQTVQVESVHRSVDAALRALRTAEQAQVLAEKVNLLAEKSLAAEQRRLELGRATQLDVLEVQQKSAEAALAVERARADRVVAAARLQALTGRLLDAYGLKVEELSAP